MINQRYLIKNISLKFYGGFGNNLQQIALAIMFSEKYNKNLTVDNHQFIDKVSYKNSKNPFDRFIPNYSDRFFYYGSKQFKNYLIDYPLDINDFYFYYKNFHKTFKLKIRNQVNFLYDKKINNKALVIHIRKLEGHPNYVQNPINYYKILFEKYDEVLIVTDDPESELISTLKKQKKLQIQSSTLQEDFNTLVNSTNLATSGVGTFSVAAAMLSNKLQNIYYSNYFMDSHLNPEMLLPEIKKTKLTVQNYTGFGSWDKNKDYLMKKILSNVEVNVDQ